MGRDTSDRIGRAARLGANACGLLARRPAKVMLAARMAFWVVALSALARLLPLPRVMRLMTPLRRTPAAPENPERVQERVAETLDAILRADIWVFTPTCWKRAPVLYRYLLLEGIPTRVVFGMRKEDGGVAGHAWLEREGRPLLEKTAPAYAVTFVFPKPAERT